MYDVNWDVNEHSDINTEYDAFNTKLNEVVDKHAPFKERKILAKQVPYMNKTLKSAIYNKKMMYNKYQKVKSKQNWEK